MSNHSSHRAKDKQNLDEMDEYRTNLTSPLMINFRLATIIMKAPVK